MNPVLRINNLSVDFITEQQTTQAVKNISLEVNKGELLALVGESGSGKSVTSLSILQLLPRPPARYTSGSILFREEGQEPLDLLQADGATLRSIRGSRIGMIFQEPMTSLNPVMSCGRQVMEALLVHRRTGKKEARLATIEWFRRVKLPAPEEMFDRYPHQLSGGQKQRVMIAMAMIGQPSLLICDEPTTALDVTVQKTILELIRELQQQHNMGVLFITHDLGVVAEIANRVAIMYKGEIVEQNITAAIFSNPTHPYTQALIACRPGLHDRRERLPVVADFLNENRILETAPEKIVHPTGAANSLLLEVKNLSVRFPGKKNLLGRPKDYFTAVDDVSFSIYKGETLGLVGESGCGKTTLGRTLMRLVEPSEGSIRYGEKEITALSPAEVGELRKEIQLVFQDPYSSLNPRLTIGSALAEPIKLGKMGRDAKERRKRVSELLEKVNLSSSMQNRYPHEFSGGQRQRIVIARALSLEPGFLICDESVSALDVSVQAQVLNLLNDLKRELQLTMLFISHDLSVVRYMCDRIMVMRKGKIIETGSADEVYHHPQNEYTRQLIAAIPNVRTTG